MLEQRSLGATGLVTSVIGLGCSRLGSVLGADRTEAANLITAALGLGVTFFDTANIYGQGDSERVLGSILPKKGVIVATKVGQMFPLAMRSLAALKRPLAPIIRSTGFGRTRTAAIRAKPLPKDFSPNGIRRSIEGSLRRLRREPLDVVFLHGPDVETLRKGEALGTLVDLRHEGKVRAIGVSGDDSDVVEAALSDVNVAAVQCRLDHYPNCSNATFAAQNRGVAIVAREIFGGVKHSAAQITRPAVGEAVRAAMARPFVSVALVGTTRAAHLAEAVAALNDAEDGHHAH